MFSVETQYLYLSRNMLLMTGLWPYRQSKFVKFQYMLFRGIMMLTILFHFATFITAEYTADFIVKVLSSTFSFICITIPYNTFGMYFVPFKDFLEKLQHTCETLKDVNEIAIIQKYGDLSRRYIFWLTVLTFSSQLVLILIQTWSVIFDWVAPRNESRPLFLVFPTIQIVNQQKYIYLILFHTNAAIFIGIVALLAIGTTHFACQKFVCGMLTVARFSEFLMSTFEVTLALSALMAVISLSLNLYRLFQIMSSGFNFQELFLPTVFSVIMISFMFIANYIGQDLTDHNNQIFVIVYNVQWYKAPLCVQKLILFLLQRGSKDFNLSVGGIMTGSLQCFATLMNTSVSYFTVLYSTQK